MGGCDRSPAGPGGRRLALRAPGGGQRWRRVRGVDGAARQRRSVEEAGALVRRAVMAANPRRMPPEAVEELCLWQVGFLKGLGDLLFYSDTEETWARATTELRVARRESRRRGDPLRARFRDLVEVLEAALFSAPELGRGETTYATAMNKGRTRARWDEIYKVLVASQGGAYRDGKGQLNVDFAPFEAPRARKSAAGEDRMTAREGAESSPAG